MNLGTTRLRGRPRNRWQDEVREDGRIVGGEGWQEKVHNREEWKKLLSMARNHRILHMPMEWMNNQHYSTHTSSNEGKFLKAVMKELCTFFFIQVLTALSTPSMESHTWPWSSSLFLEKGGNCLVPRLHHMAHVLRWWDPKSQLPPWWSVRCESFIAEKYSSCTSRLFFNSVSKFWVLQYCALSWNSMKLIHSYHMSSISLHPLHCLSHKSALPGLPQQNAVLTSTQSSP